MGTLKVVVVREREVRTFTIERMVMASVGKRGPSSETARLERFGGEGVPPAQITTPILSYLRLKAISRTHKRTVCIRYIPGDLQG